MKDKTQRQSPSSPNLQAETRLEAGEGLDVTACSASSFVRTMPEVDKILTTNINDGIKTNGLKNAPQEKRDEFIMQTIMDTFQNLGLMDDLIPTIQVHS